jgi:diacylglycerol kinase family enzyme
MREDVVVILNATAGAGGESEDRCGAEWQAQLRGAFERGGLAAQVVLARDGGEIVAAARAAVAAGARRIVAGGGDGTINAVAAQLIGSDATLGVLPLGTLNHFARDLGIPLALPDAIQVIVDDHAVRVDAAQVNDRVFINNSGLGLYPDIVRDRERQQSRLGRGKWPAFCWAVLSALRRYPFLSVRLLIGGKQHARDTPFVFIGNNEYLMEGLNIGTRTRLDGACLSLYVAQRPGRLGLLRLAIHALFSRLNQARDFDMLTAGEITIETRHRRLRVATDGEVTIMSTPLHYRILPAALKVNVPRPTASTGSI